MATLTNGTWITWASTADTTTAGDTWSSWNMMNTSSATTTNKVWASWNETPTITENHLNCSCWYTWTTTDNTMYVRQEVSDQERHNGHVPTRPQIGYDAVYRAPSETEEERAARVARMAANERARIARVAKKKEEQIAARTKAEKLLRQHLSPAQLKQYDTHKHFDVKIESRHYRIHDGWAGNVLLMKGKNCVASFCIHPRMTAPNQDNMLAQKFLLETDEQEFLKIANRCEHPGGYAFHGNQY